MCKYKYLIPESQDDLGEDQHIHQEPSAWKKKRTRQTFFFKTWIEKRESNKIFAHYMKENSGEKRRPQEEKFNESQNRECSAKTEFIFKKSIADVTKAPSFSLLLTLFALGGGHPWCLDMLK